MAVRTRLRSRARRLWRLGRVRPELPAVGKLRGRHQVLMSAWLTGLRSEHHHGTSAGIREPLP